MTTLVIIHTALSFIALGLGIPATLDLFGRSLNPLWTKSFILTAAATTLTGFFIQVSTVTPALVTGIVSTFVLIAVLLARYKFHYAGKWRIVYAAGVIMSFYLLVFVTIAQAFLKVLFLNNLAPTLSEPPFGISQLVTVIFFGWLGIKAVKAFKPTDV